MVHTEDNRFVGPDDDDSSGDSGSDSNDSNDGGSDISFSEPEVVDESRTPDFRDDDSGDSGSDNSDDGGGDSSTAVTVTGDPGSSEGQTVVGRGDTVRESEIDAATNEDFDADEGTDIDDFEESFGTDQPSSNPDDSASSSTSVVVTENEQGEQVTVGQGQTTEGARTQAAANPQFDAAQGEEVDAFEEQLGRGQGDGTQPEALQQQRQTNNSNQNRRTDPGFFEKAQRLSNREQRQRQRQGGVQGDPKFTSIETFANPNRGNPNATITQEALTAGVDLSSRGQEFAENATRPLREIQNERSSIITERVNKADNRTDLNLERPDFQATNVINAFATGVATGGTQLAGLGLATAGGVPEALKETTPSLSQGAAKGLDITGEQASDAPGEFVASELGEEVPEAVIGAAVGGPIGAALGLAPTPTLDITTTVKTKAGNAADFVKTNVADPNALGSGAGAFVPPESKTGLASDPRPGQGNNPDILQVDTTGFDLQTEATTSETTQAQTTSNDATGFDLEIGSATATTPTTDAASQPRDTPADDILSRPEAITEGKPENVTEGKPEVITEGKPEAKVESRPDFIVESPPKVEPEIVQEVRPETKPEPRPDPTPTLDLGEDEEDDDKNNLLFSSEGQDTQFRSSVGAELIGFTAEEKPDRATVSDPTNLRPVLEN